MGEIEKAHTKKETRNCVHAMFTGLCKDVEIKSHCCGSCTADDGAVCVDKPAGELASILGKPGVSCGLLAQEAAVTILKSRRTAVPGAARRSSTRVARSRT